MRKSVDIHERSMNYLLWMSVNYPIIARLTDHYINNLLEKIFY